MPQKLRCNRLHGGAIFLIKERGTILLGNEVNCPFCSPAEAEKVLVSELCSRPVGLLITPNHHPHDYFSVTMEEKTALWRTVK